MVRIISEAKIDIEEDNDTSAGFTTPPRMEKLTSLEDLVE